MAKSWYILHTYTGYEGKIERTLRTLLSSGEIDPAVLTDVKVPVEEVVEIRDGKKHSRRNKFLPGYIMLEMDLPQIGWKAVCSSIRRIQGVTGFVGTKPLERPRPITSDEARNLLQKSGDIKGDKPVHIKQSYEVGESVKIIQGPMSGFVGTVEEVNTEKNKLRVMVQIFGRSTPAELDILGVEKV